MRKHFCTGDTGDVSTPSFIQTVMMPGTVDWYELRALLMLSLFSFYIRLIYLQNPANLPSSAFICACFTFSVSDPKSVNLLLHVGFPCYTVFFFFLIGYYVAVQFCSIKPFRVCEFQMKISVWVLAGISIVLLLYSTTPIFFRTQSHKVSILLLLMCFYGCLCQPIYILQWLINKYCRHGLFCAKQLMD